MTQEELDAIAQKEADELLAAHRAVVTMTPEQIAAAEREKALLVARIDQPVASGPVARRLAHRGAGGAEAEPYEPPRIEHLPPHGTPASPRQDDAERAQKAHDRGTVKTLVADLENVDPIQLAELAEDAKAKKKSYLALQVACDNARTEYEAAQARFMAYLQQ